MQTEPQDAGKGNRQIKIHAPEGQRPVFSNSVQITVSNEEVALQFVFIRPNASTGTLVSEVVLTPQHAIRFKNALDETIKKHFTKHLPT